MIELIMGPMFSGKSAYSLNKLNLLDKNKKIAIYIPKHSYRGFFSRVDSANEDFNEKINEKNSNVKIFFIKSFYDLLDETLDSFFSNYDQIFIDEFHLMSDYGFYVLMDEYLKYGKTDILCSALNGSSEQEPFILVDKLIPYVSSIHSLTTECHICKSKDAIYTAWNGDKKKDEIVHVGDSEYIAVCENCLSSKIFMSID